MDSDFCGGSQSQLTEHILPNQNEYDKCVLFHWRAGVTEPFVMFPKEKFGPTEIRDLWYKHQMLPKCRIKLLRGLKCYPGESWSMFAKVQKGILTPAFLFFDWPSLFLLLRNFCV